MYSFKELMTSLNGYHSVEVHSLDFLVLSNALIDDKVKDFTVDMSAFHERKIGLESKINFNKADFNWRISRDEIKMWNSHTHFDGESSKTKELTLIIRIRNDK